MRNDSHAALERERVRALRAVRCRASSLATWRRWRSTIGRVGRVVDALVDRSRDAGHRWQVIAAVLAFDLRRKRAAHGEPHDDFGALEAAELRVFGDGHRSQLFRIALEQVEEALVPFGVVETRALAVHLVR